MKRLIAIIVVAGLSYLTPVQADEELYYAELLEWVFQPCMEVGTALDVKDLDTESVELGIKREHIAMLMLADRDSKIRDLAATFAGGSKNPSWEERRELYPSILRLCLSPFLDK